MTTFRRPRAIACASWLAIPTLLGLSDVRAQEVDFALTAGATYSDNVGRTSSDEQADTTIDAGLRLGLSDDQGRLTSAVSADLSYRSYLDDTFEDELVGGLDALVEYAFIPERFSWTIQNNFGQTFIDRQAIETPDNRQNTNYFSTGPNFALPLGDRTTFEIQGRWSDVALEESDLDNTRYSGGVALVRDLSATNSVSLNATAQRVEFDQSPPNSDYDIQAYYLGYQASGARTRLNLRGGYTAVHDFGETNDGILASIAVSRDVTSRTTMTLDAGTEFTDSADALRRDQGIGGITRTTADPTVSSDPFQSDYATLAWLTTRDRGSVRVSIDWRQETHDEEPDLDRERFGGQLSFTRRITERWSASLNGAYGTEDYANTDVSFDDWSAGASLEWRVSPALSLTLRADHYDSSGDSTAGPGTRDYEENRIAIEVAWSPGRR